MSNNRRPGYRDNYDNRNYDNRMNDRRNRGRDNYDGGRRDGYRDDPYRQGPSRNDPYTDGPGDRRRNSDSGGRNNKGFSFNEGSGRIIKIILIAVAAIIILLCLIRLGIALKNGFGPFVDNISQLASALFDRMVSSLIAAIVIYILLTMFAGRYIPAGVKMKLIPIFIVICLIYSFVPAFGTALGELAFIVIGLIMLISVLRM